MMGYACHGMSSLPSAGNRKTFLLVLGLTLGRIPLAVLFAILFAAFDDSFLRVVVGVVLLLLMEVSDILDGNIARRRGVVTEWGAMLDPFADSVSRLIVFWTLASAGYALWLTVLVMALRDVTVSYCRVTLTRYGRTVKAKLSGKIKAIVQAVAGIALVIGPAVEPWIGAWIYPAFSWLVIVVTTVSAGEYVRAALGAVGSANKD
jgi:CDP-diacylglycerol--glycerol-3-phosphate 3-phosphatidyltransferase